MPAVLADIADLAQHPKFVRLAAAAAKKAAVLIGNEEYDGSQYKIMRRALATAVLKDADTLDVWGAVFAWACATNPVVTLETAPDELDYIVSTVWDAIAGAYQSTSTTPTEPTPTDPTATDTGTPSA